MSEIKPNLARLVATGPPELIHALGDEAARRCLDFEIIEREDLKEDFDYSSMDDDEAYLEYSPEYVTSFCEVDTRRKVNIITEKNIRKFAEENNFSQHMAATAYNAMRAYRNNFWAKDENYTSTEISGINVDRLEVLLALATDRRIRHMGGGSIKLVKALIEKIGIKD